MPGKPSAWQNSMKRGCLRGLQLRSLCLLKSNEFKSLEWSFNVPSYLEFIRCFADMFAPSGFYFAVFSRYWLIIICSLACF
jgi:hypothetical protein